MECVQRGIWRISLESLVLENWNDLSPNSDIPFFNNLGRLFLYQYSSHKQLFHWCFAKHGVSFRSPVEEKFLVHASVCVCFLTSFKGNKTHITGVFKNNCQIRKFFLYLFTMLEGKFYMFHRLDLSCQHCLLPPGSKLYKHVWKLLYLLP